MGGEIKQSIKLLMNNFGILFKIPWRLIQDVEVFILVYSFFGQHLMPDVPYRRIYRKKMEENDRMFKILLIFAPLKLKTRENH